jgi:hypothetical protein
MLQFGAAIGGGGSTGATATAAGVAVAPGARARLQLFLQGALGVLLVDRAARRPYLLAEPGFATLFALAATSTSTINPDGGCNSSGEGTGAAAELAADERARREAAAKSLVSLVQRDADARLALIESGALRSVMGLLNPTGAVQCMDAV